MVVELKERCREQGLKVGGKKADLIARLRSNVAEVQDGEAPGSLLAEAGATRTPQHAQAAAAAGLVASFRVKVAASLDDHKRTAAKLNAAGLSPAASGTRLGETAAPAPSTDATTTDPRGAPSSYPSPAHPYTRDADEGGGGEALLPLGAQGEVDQLLAARAAARAARDFARADDLLAELRKSHGVGVDDRRLTWRADWKRGRHPTHGWRRCPRDAAANGGTLPRGFDLAAVDALLERREDDRRRVLAGGGGLGGSAAASGAFADANARRADLRHYHGVVLDDANLEWRLEGPKQAAKKRRRQEKYEAGGFGGGGSFGCGGEVRGGGAKGGGVRGEGREARGYRGGGGGGGHDYVRRPTVEGYAPRVVRDAAGVDALLGRRLAAKKARRFEDADDIRTSLKADYGVEVDDKQREWWVHGDEDGWAWRTAGSAPYGGGGGRW